ncbi:MAG: chloramphenicol-sensitive protein RarD [Phenylobacterium sp.]
MGSDVSAPNTEKQGVIYGVLAYVMWGLAPLYFKLIDFVPAPEILMQRIIWSFVLITVVIAVIKKWQNVRQVIRQPKVVLMFCGTALVLALNWGIFIWAVTNDRILDASLGYYINPLLSILLGGLFLGERLKKWQGVAVGLAFTGVMIQVLSFGSFPLLSVCLATSFAFYGLFRKKMPVDSVTGLLMESAVMMPIALGYWLLFADSSAANMTINSWSLNLLLIGTGLVTTLPLLCFTAATKRLKLSTLGFLQYIGPSFMFVQAVFIYNEPIDSGRWITFAFIWTALLIFSWDSIRGKLGKSKE